MLTCTDWMASIEIGCLMVGRPLASRPKVSLMLTPSMVIELKRVSYFPHLA